MPEAPANPPDPQDDLREEMQYALRLAEERERSAQERIGSVKRQFSKRYARLEERARLAERNADRAEIAAAEAEDRVSKSLQALGLLRRGLASVCAHNQSKRR